MHSGTYVTPKYVEQRTGQGQPVPAPKPTRSLFDIGEDFRAIDDLLEECGGDITGVEATIDQWFAEADANLVQKAEGYCWFMRELAARADARKAEAARLAARAKTDQATHDWLRGRLLEFLQERGMAGVQTKSFRATVCRNGGLPPLLIDDAVKAHPDSLPPGLYRTVVTHSVDTDAVRRALESGATIDGCAIGERGVHLRVS